MRFNPARWLASVGLGLRLAQEIVGAAVAFMEAVQLRTGAGEEVVAERQAVLHHLMTNVFRRQGELKRIAESGLAPHARGTSHKY